MPGDEVARVTFDVPATKEITPVLLTRKFPEPFAVTPMPLPAVTLTGLAVGAGDGVTADTEKTPGTELSTVIFELPATTATGVGVTAETTKTPGEGVATVTFELPATTETGVGTVPGVGQL